jgi:hypothetical protein
MTSAFRTSKVHLKTSEVIFCQGSLKQKIENRALNKIENPTFDNPKATFANRNLEWWSSVQGSNNITIKKNATVSIHNFTNDTYSNGFLNANIATDTIECKYFKITNPKPLFSAAIA